MRPMAPAGAAVRRNIVLSENGIQTELAPYDDDRIGVCYLDPRGAVDGYTAVWVVPSN